MIEIELLNKKQPLRSELPKNANLCEYCTAKCCRYVALPLPHNPTKWPEFEEIRWFMTHEDINVFVDEGDWYLLVHRKCQYLQEDYRCGIYHTRPYICREYSTDNCEYDEHYLYEKVFEHDAQVDEYAEALLGTRPPYQPKPDAAKRPGPKKKKKAANAVK